MWPCHSAHAHVDLKNTFYETRKHPPLIHLGLDFEVVPSTKDYTTKPNWEKYKKIDEIPKSAHKNLKNPNRAHGEHGLPINP